jgi:hypothetical protein
LPQADYLINKFFKQFKTCFKNYIKLISLFLLACILTAIFLNHSAWRGRLQYDIDYEDMRGIDLFLFDVFWRVCHRAVAAVYDRRNLLNQR